MWKVITANTIYQVFGKGFSLAAGTLTIALVARSLGTSGFGDYILITTVPALLYLLADFGLNAIFLREVARDDGHLRKFSSLLGLRLILAAVFFLLGAIYVFFSPYGGLIKLGILLGLLTVFSQAVFTSLNALFQHNLRYDLSVLAGILSASFGVILIVLGFLRGGGLLFFVGVWVLTAFLLTSLAFLFARRLREGPLFSWEGVWMRRLFILALPLGITLLFSQINGKADVFLLSLLDTSESIGIYGLAYKVFANLLVLPLFFVNALYPVMLRDRRKSLSLLWRRLREGVLAMFLVSLVLTLLTVVFAPLAIRVLGGEGFESSALVLRLLSLGLPLFFVTVPLQWFLITLGRERILPLIYGVAALSNVGINLVFIPQFSYFASIFATIFSEMVIFVLLLAVVVKLWIIRPRR